MLAAVIIYFIWRRMMPRGNACAAKKFQFKIALNVFGCIKDNAN